MTLVTSAVKNNIDLSRTDAIVEKFGTKQNAVIPILQAIQEEYRYLPEEALRRVCEITDITPASISGVASFYSQFRHKPVGRHLISVCHGTACHVKGAELVHDAILRDLGISGDDDTDRDGVFTVQKVSCLGCCTLAPALQIDGITYGHLTPDTVHKSLKDFLQLEQRGAVASRFTIQHKEPKLSAEIRIGMGSCCIAGGSSDVRDALETAIHDTHAAVAVKTVGCVGMCHRTPLVEVIAPDGGSTMYAKVDANDAAGIVKRHFKPHGIIRQLKAGLSGMIDSLLTDESWEPVTRYSIDVREPSVHAFAHRQLHLATETCGRVDPLNLDEYIQHEGFTALRKCIDEHTPQEVIEAIRQSGLRGRGGAGFPTGDKWNMVRKSEGELKYIICNGDEGDPGAFMDRMMLESYPYRVLEGMAIAAYAVGASEGYLYIRAEYPLAVKRIKEAIEVCQNKGLLGEHVAGSSFSLNLHVMEGAGAFVCGEETALMASIEGRRGNPRLRPPYPAESGLWGKPTSINNVETYALVPWIMRNGHEEFAALGTGKSKGTKVFALAGKIVRGGLIEVPMGITVNEIVNEIGGGVPNGRKFKAVQIGGPSGGCIPAQLGDTPVDYETLKSVGAIMGSGGLVVIDDTDCMVDIARYFIEFTQRESCGKCTFCRVGTQRMLDILTRLCSGKGKHGDIEKLEELAHQVKLSSLCGLGQTAPNPVLSTLRYFRDEYEAHIAGHCPAGKCRALIHYTINDQCIGCTKCAQKCPTDAISILPYQKHEIDQLKCIRCDTCRHVCPTDAVTVN